MSQNTWTSPRAKKIARQVAFREMSWIEVHRSIAVLQGIELLRRYVLPGTMNDAEEQLAFDLVDTLIRQYGMGQLTPRQALLLGAAWNGELGKAGWQTVAHELAPHVRGSAAYMLGMRLLHNLGQPDQARTLFQQAAAESAGGSPLAELAQQAIKQLPKP